ncbi:hypothetical protein IEQ34_016287 [Dendrobium chrysotoxum]|uniref:Uncharacterized protein n=1 Tax=Dendrobium chrysotoxum TaxID=161865 RepID=A0AAV7GF14_DENCH|nr:hypothetical protein IEQ34_016287 [Dendrobium chrysotoxum]
MLKAENKRSQTFIVEKEATLSDIESSRDHVQEARDHIYEVEVKALEQQCIDKGFIRGFSKGVHLVQRKVGVEVTGLTPSQASDDSPIDFDGAKIVLDDSHIVLDDQLFGLIVPDNTRIVLDDSAQSCLNLSGN